MKNRGEVDQFYIENSHPAIISQEIFDKVQALRKKKKAPVSAPSKFPLTRKMICGKCGATFYRTVDRHGANNWVCSGHKDGNRNGKGACPNLPVRERDIYTAFIRMYNKLRLHEGIILRPALDQMEALESAVQRENPAMLEVNRAIAQATEQNYKISKLRASGLLDADACAAKLAALDAQLTQLRAKRRRLLRNDDISEMADTPWKFTSRETTTGISAVSSRKSSTSRRTSQKRTSFWWLEARPFTTAFVTGNHENFDALQKYPLEKWRGGSIRRICPSVILLERGQIFTLGVKRFFTMGGASSHDIQDGILEPDDPLLKRKCRELDAKGAMYRINHLSWWKEELPSETEYQTARASLDRAGWEVDYIITHCCPSSVQDIFSGGLYQKDALTEFFDEIRQRCQFKYWFFGHYHEDMVIEKKYVMLYEQIIRLKL